MNKITNTEADRMGRMSMAGLALIFALILSNFMLANEASAAHTFDTKLRFTGTGNPLTSNYTVGSGGTLLVVSIVTAGNTPRTGTPTYNGVALIQADSNRVATETVTELWYLSTPPTGSAYMISIPNSGALTLYAIASSYKAQAGYTSVLDVVNGNAATGGGSANPSVSVTTTANGDVIVGAMGNGNTNAPTAPTGTLLYATDNGSYSDNGQYYLQATAGTFAMSWTVAADDWGFCVAAFKEVPKPTVTSTSPNALQGTTSLITINGTNFVSGATASFSSTGITVNSTTFVSSTQLTVNITIAAGATIGLSDVTVTNPDGSSGTGTGVFTVFAALTCASAGSSGPATPSGVINTYYPGTASAAAGSSTITLGAASGTTPITAGDLLLIIQMQDADISSANDASYGAGTTGGSGYTALNSAGLYEYVTASGAVPLAGGTLTITSGLVNSYRDRNYVAGTNGQSSFQVIRVPQYSTATVASATTVTAPAWNGTTGGVVVMDVAGTLTIDGSIVADGIGFRGGMGRTLTGGAGANTDYVTLATTATNGSKAEGIAGTPRYVNQPASFDGAPNQVDTGVEGYPNGSYGRGAPGNAGGGSTDGHPVANDQNSGGGGGGNYGSGAQGGNSWNSNLQVGGEGGSSITALAFNRVVMGGGGGAGTTNNGTSDNTTYTNPPGVACSSAAGACSSGATGGGIIILRANLFAGAGTISADGGDGYNVANDSGGGGGAGGSIVLYSQLGGTANASVSGGNGGNAWRTGGTTLADRHGPGGGGGGGFLAYSPSSGFSITINVAGGLSGRTTTLADPYGTTSSSGGVYVFDYTVIPGLQPSNTCMPSLTVSKSTTTPSISGLPGTATYTISVTNSGAATAGQVTISDALPGVPSLFTNSSAAPTIAYSPNTAPCNTSRSSTTNAATGTSIPAWSSWDIPANCTVSLTFNATVPSNTVPMTYQNPATVTYFNPLGTTPEGPISITYNSASSTAEDVTVLAPPSISKSFASSLISAGGNTLLAVTLTNTNSTPITAVGFTDTLPTTASGAPGNMTIMNPVAPSTTCGGSPSYTAVNGSGSFSVSGLTIPANSSCQVSYTVTASATGIYVNTIPAGALSSSAGGNLYPVTNALTVGFSQQPPAMTKSFLTNPIQIGGTTTLRFTLTNPNSASIGSAGFIDTLPTGIVVASTPNVVNTCGGTVTATPASNFISLNTDGTIPATGSCAVSVDVTGMSAGLFQNTSGQVVGDTGAGNRATDNLRVMAPLLIAKSFAVSSVTTGTATAMSIQLTNPNSIAVTGAAFTDAYPANLVNATPASGATTCTAGTVTATNGGTSLGFSGGTIPANSSCTVTVNVQSSVNGYYTNSTGTVTTTNAGSADSASATLGVLSPPVVQKSFSPTAITSGGQSTMLILISNPASNPTSLTGVAVSDTYTGTMTNAAAASVTCTSGSFTSLTGGANGGTTVGMSAATILPGGTCRIVQSVTATSNNTNTTTAPTSTNGGTGVAATAYLKIIQPLMVSKTFTPSHTANGTDTQMTITLTNPNEVTVNNISFTDTYPANFTNSSTNPNPQFSPANCAGAAATITGGTASGTTIGLSAGSIAANTACSITVNVRLTANNTFRLNSTGTVTTSNAGTSLGDTATLSNGTGTAPVELTKSFSPVDIMTGGTSALTFSIYNPHTATQTGITFTDPLPTGVTATNVGATSVCSGIATYTITGGNLISFTTNAAIPNTLAAGGTCTFTINTVTSSASGVYNNRTSQIVSSTASGNYAEAVLTVYYPPSVSKSFGISTLAPGATTTLTISIANPNPIPFTLTGNFDDVFPTSPGAMTLANGTVTNNTCGITPTNTAGGALSAGNTGVRIPNGSSIPAGGCQYTVNVTANTAGTFTNTIAAGALNTNAGTNAAAASAQLTVSKLGPMVSKTFVPAKINAGGTSTLIVTFLNPNSVPVSLTSIFTDTFPTGVVTASTPSYSTTCSGGTAGGAAGNLTLSSGAVIPAGTLSAPGSCTLQVNVTAASAGIYTNTITAGALQTSSGNNASSASAVLTVTTISPPTVSKAFDAVGIGNTGLVSKLTLTLSNTNPGTATLTANMDDNFPTNLVIASPNGLSGTCTLGSVTAVAGTGLLRYASGATIPAGGCTIAVNVTSSVVASYTNTIAAGALLTDLGSNPGPTSDTINVYPTLASIGSFDAREENGSVAVEWTTLSESNTAGFYLYRWDETTGEYARLNQSLLPGLITEPQGGTYRLVDKGAVTGKSYTYMLEEVEVKGRKNLHGPYEVGLGTGQAKGTLQKPSPDVAKTGPVLSTDSTGLQTVSITGSGAVVSSGDQIGGYTREPNPRVARGGVPLLAKTVSSLSLVNTPATGSLIKIFVSEDGLYSLDVKTIAGLLGLSVQNVATMIQNRMINLTTGGQGVSYIEMTGNSGIKFYGQKTENNYVDEGIYLLKPSLAGQKMGTSGIISSAPAAGGSFTETKHYEKNVYTYTTIFDDPEADYWFWDYVVAGDAVLGSKSFTLNAPGVSAGTATLTVRLQGITDSLTGKDHHAVISLNGTELGEGSWTGAGAKTIVMSIPQNLLVAGDNTVEVLGELDSGVPYSLFFLNNMDLQYQREYIAENDRLRFRGEQNAAVTVSGFSGPQISLYNVTTPMKPVYVTGGTISGSNGSYSLSFVPQGGNTVYLTVAQSGIMPATAVAGTATTLRAKTNKADYLIITTEDLKTEVQRLATYRQSQKFKTMTVLVGQIMDEFNFGSYNPNAIKTFLSYAAKNWTTPPKFVLLAGSGNYDYKGNLGLGGNLVPVLMVGTPDGLYPSDTSYADIDGDGVPELFIGRLPAANTTEMKTLIDKILGYESGLAGSWTKRVVMAADDADGGGDFPSDRDAVAALLPGGFTTQKVTVGEKPLDEVRSDMFGWIQSGAGLLNYIGHGAWDRMAQEGLLTIGDVGAMTNAVQPFVAGMTCVIGNYGMPGIVSLSETLVLRPQGGAVAVWSPTGMSLNNEAIVLDKMLVQKMYGPGGAQRVGEIVTRVLEAYATGQSLPFMINIYNLLGDPALILKK